MTLTQLFDDLSCDASGHVGMATITQHLNLSLQGYRIKCRFCTRKVFIRRVCCLVAPCPVGGSAEYLQLQVTNMRPKMAALWFNAIPSSGLSCLSNNGFMSGIYKIDKMYFSNASDTINADLSSKCAPSAHRRSPTATSLRTSMHLSHIKALLPLAISRLRCAYS